MMWIDTNIVVRLLVADDRDQLSRSQRLISENEVSVSLTVLLEAEWVLRGFYEFPIKQVVSALRAFASLATVVLEDAPRVLQALDWAEQGMDFSDALHLAGCRRDDVFVSFDRDLAKRARRLNAPEVRAP